MTTPSPKLLLVPSIILGALVGALALMLLISLPDLFLRAVQGNFTDLTRILTSVVYDAFTSSLGAVGALVGGTVAWKQLRARPATDAQVDDPNAVSGKTTGIWSKSWRILHPGEATLALGFVFLLASFGVYPSVLTWLLALWTLPLAGVLLAIGHARSRDRSASADQLFLGSGLLLFGLFALGMAAFFGTDLSYKLAFHVQRPTSQVPNFREWARFAGSCLFSVLLVGSGLRLWTDWPRGRRIGWCVVMLLFPVAAMLLHRTLVSIGFLSLTA